TLERSDRPFAPPPVTIVPAALDWPARVAHRYAAATRSHPLPDLSDHGLVPRRRTHRSFPGNTAHFARALRRSDRRSRRPQALTHRHSGRPRAGRGARALPGEPDPLRHDAARLPRDVLRFAARALPVLRRSSLRGRSAGAWAALRGARGRLAHRSAHIGMDEAGPAPGS